MFRQHQPEKLRVKPDAILPHPAYSLVLALRLLALRDTRPDRWQRALALTSHIESEKSNVDWLFMEATSIPLLNSCGMSEDDINYVKAMLATTRYW